MITPFFDYYDYEYEIPKSKDQIIKENGHRFDRNHWCLYCDALQSDLRKNPEIKCVGVVHNIPGLRF